MDLAFCGNKFIRLSVHTPTKSKLMGSKYMNIFCAYVKKTLQIFFCYVGYQIYISDLPSCNTVKSNPLPNAITAHCFDKWHFSYNHKILDTQMNAIKYKSIFHHRPSNPHKQKPHKAL